MQELTAQELNSIHGGNETAWQATKRIGGKVAGRVVPVVNAVSAGYDAKQAWDQSRAAGDGRGTAALKATGAAVESATWPLVPLAREAFGVRPAY